MSKKIEINFRYSFWIYFLHKLSTFPFITVETHNRYITQSSLDFFYILPTTMLSKYIKSRLFKDKIQKPPNCNLYHLSLHRYDKKNFWKRWNSYRLIGVGLKYWMKVWTICPSRMYLLSSQKRLHRTYQNYILAKMSLIFATKK